MCRVLAKNDDDLVVFDSRPKQHRLTTSHMAFDLLGLIFCKHLYGHDDDESEAEF